MTPTTPTGPFTCPDCPGREFRLVLHLRRHRTATHGDPSAAPRRPRRRARRPVPRRRPAPASLGLGSELLAFAKRIAVLDAQCREAVRQRDRLRARLDRIEGLAKSEPAVRKVIDAEKKVDLITRLRGGRV